MLCAWLITGAIVAHGYNEMPTRISGDYWSSCGTSYCKGAEVYCTPQANNSSILNRPSGYGYSVTYNYGLEPQPGRTTWSASSSGYNHGGYMK